MFSVNCLKADGHFLNHVWLDSCLPTTNILTANNTQVTMCVMKFLWMIFLCGETCENGSWTLAYSSNFVELTQNVPVSLLFISIVLLDARFCHTCLRWTHGIIISFHFSNSFSQNMCNVQACFLLRTHFPFIFIVYYHLFRSLCHLVGSKNPITKFFFVLQMVNGLETISREKFWLSKIHFAFKI